MVDHGLFTLDLPLWKRERIGFSLQTARLY